MGAYTDKHMKPKNTHLEIGKPGRRIHGKDKLGEEPEPEGRHAEARQGAAARPSSSTSLS